LEYGKPEPRLNIDRDHAATPGISIQDISRTMQILFGDLDLGYIEVDDRRPRRKNEASLAGQRPPIANP